MCFPPHTKLWCPSCDFHSRSFMQVSSAISFRLPPASISAAASSGSPLMFRFRFPSFSRPDISRPIAASCQLSDPRCFRFLSSASVLGSDYSASVSSFPFLPVSASQWLPPCTVSAFASSVFHLPPCLVSHAFLPVSCTRLCCMFPFALPCFAPTAVPQVLASAFASAFFTFLPLSFVRFRSVSGYLAFCFFRSIFPHFCLTAASMFLPLCFRFPAFPFPFHPVSRVSLPILCTWLSVCFLSSFPVSLPRLFRWCSSFTSSGCSSFTWLSFVRFRFRL